MAPLRLAQASTQLGRFEEAEVYARNSIAQRPSDLAAYVALSNVLTRQNKREEALEIRKQIPKPDPNPNVEDQKYELSFRGFASHNYAQLGSAYAAHGSFSVAEQFFVRYAVDQLGTIDAYLVLIEAFRAIGDRASSFNAYLKAKAIAPNDPRLATFNP